MLRRQTGFNNNNNNHNNANNQSNKDMFATERVKDEVVKQYKCWNKIKKDKQMV